ncbi:MAG: hypothetical protein ACK4TA_06725 [Saprospiraceae bacterium]
MITESSLHLWSFQAMEACEVLESSGLLRAEWYRTPVNWRPAYFWMAEKMQTKKIDLEGFAPIWAWHSCDGILHGFPTVGTARQLLSDLQINSGICVIEFEAPAHLCLLSSYNRFCELIDAFFEQEHPEQEAFQDMFMVPPLSEYDSIQAALPMIQMDWVLDIRYLDLKADRWEYDWKKAV